LVFDIRAVAVLINPDAYGIDALHEGGNVKLRRVPGALRVANFNTIQPAVESRINSLETKSKLTSGKMFRQSERADIAACLVVLKGNCI
jgi:hypothetical protein